MFTTIQFARHNFNIYFLYQRKTMFLSFYERKLVLLHKASLSQRKRWKRSDPPPEIRAWIWSHKNFLFLYRRRNLSQKALNCLDSEVSKTEGKKGLIMILGQAYLGKGSIVYTSPSLKQVSF